MVSLCNRILSFFEHSHHLQKWGIPASSLQLISGDISPETEAAGSTGVSGSDSSCPTFIIVLIDLGAKRSFRLMPHSAGTA
jgi:hypothetical protein